MGPKEILDCLMPIFEEDPGQLLLEINSQFPDLQFHKVRGYYNRGYKELIKAIAEIKGEIFF